MIWLDWVLVSLFALGALSTISNVGKPRQPITHSVAVVTVCIQAALIVAIVTEAAK